MKPYGNTRRDNRTCEWGCCAHRALLGYRRRRRGLWCRGGDVTRVLRRGRSKARQQARRDASMEAEG